MYEQKKTRPQRPRIQVSALADDCRTMASKDERGTKNFIAEPLQWDILCGKTKECIVHTGSKRFRSVIEAYKHLYIQALTKFDKMKVTKGIYELLTRANSRFLRYNEAQSSWEELSVLAARDKVGHALRFANRETNKSDSESNRRSDTQRKPIPPSSSKPLVQQTLELTRQGRSPCIPIDMNPNQPILNNSQTRQDGSSLKEPVQQDSNSLMATTLKLASDTMALLNSVATTVLLTNRVAPNNQETVAAFAEASTPPFREYYHGK